MDDGYKNGRGFCFCTNCFTFKEVQFLQQLLKHNFNLDTTIQKSNLGQPVLYVKSSCREKFIELVSPYMCESMMYKLAL